jgi:hypothetical protein
MRTIKTELDSNSVDTSRFDEVELYTKPIENEIFPKNEASCFPGAWYRKVVSSKDAWLGIEGVIQLGEFTPDETRFNLDGKHRYMDNHNLYMGGCSCEESDCGLGYNTMYTTCDTKEDLNLASPKLGYRPFYRYICHERIDEDGNTDVVHANFWRVTNPRSLCYYYFPGDVVRMKVYSPIPNYLQMRIEVIECTKIEKYVKIREQYHLKDNRPKDYCSPLFYSEGHGIHPAEFKRVNSIDQYGNEGKIVKSTNATVSQEIWKECFLYREVDHKLVKVPFTKNRQISLCCPNSKAVSLQEYQSERGGEILSIAPDEVKVK